MAYILSLFTVLLSLPRRISRASRLEENPVPNSPNTLLVLVDFYSSLQHYASNICINRIDKKNLIMNYVDLRQNKEYITIIIVNVLYPFKSQ